ncbi:flotillin family protein [Comamonas resistens]|uniref:Flotillin family protein n=1 Tax=Comamonas resistens TaxID=3046670 RepID=A0ABY8SRN0_9BURK|nr:flotillin family protein [Comamonas resistens]MDL5037104.1 flotillin family protein [Comamonas resistens]WHS65695.1 flotillin family protein [Comamonas resistens]
MGLDNMEWYIVVGVVIGSIFIIILGLFALIKAFYIKVPQGTALIINDTTSQPKVKFTGGLVLPVIHKKEFMRISLITLEIDRRGKEGLICKDNMRADITVAFYLRVNETAQDVLKVAKAIGVERASDKVAVNELFNAKFSEALKTVGKQIDFVKLFENRQDFRDQIIHVIGNDLNGYVLEDVAIDYLEQTPKSSLDPNNILDSEGIRKITELTANQNIVTNELERNAELAVTKKNVETKEAMLALERQQADAEARQKREIATIQAREQAETQKVQEEERLKAEQARIQTQEQLDIREENRQREVAVAQQNRERAVVIEVEKVTRARDLEVVARQREVELQRIEKEKAIEVEKANIANVVRERVAVEKTVAQEEERIKEVRAVSEAERMKQVTVLTAEAAAQEELVRQVKKAEADETASRHKAVEVTTMAQAELEAAGKTAEAKKKLAEAIEVERAAPGLADAKVREVTAAAIEKEGMAQAKVIAEKLLAEARGEQEKGLAEVRVIEAQADANEKLGLADAKVLEERLLAQARGEAQVGNTKAVVTREVGQSEADVLQGKLFAEAKGLTEKFSALGSLSDQARSHEEFRMQLEKNFEQALAAIEANKTVAQEQAEVLSAALSKANIDIVGGGGDFFNNFAKALSVGKAVEGVSAKSPIVQELLGKFLGGKSLSADTLSGLLNGGSKGLPPAQNSAE